MPIPSDDTTVQRCPACESIAIRGTELGFEEDVPACPCGLCPVSTFRVSRYIDEQEIRDELATLEHVDSEVAEIPVTDGRGVMEEPNS